MKRTPLKRKTPLRSKSKLKSTKPTPKRKPLKQQSAAKRQELKDRAELRQLLLRERGELCEAKTKPSVCNGVWTDPHEIKMRSAEGDCLDPENILCVCRQCHDYIHQHPAESYEKGWLKHSWE